MKKMKNNLDERQELELLRIEHNGCWLAFLGLLIVMLIQLLTGNDGARKSGRRMGCLYVSLPCISPLPVSKMASGTESCGPHSRRTSSPAPLLRLLPV